MVFQYKTRAQENRADTLLFSLMNRDPGFSSYLKQDNGLEIQIIYTTIDRTRKGKPVFTDHFFNVDTGRYFYPASTVKLPVAILALEKLNKLKVQGLDMNSTMITGAEGGRQTEVSNDPSACDGRPSIAQYIKKIFLVSDNDAFNRLYEFLGQEYLNNRLHELGYTEARIIHRLSISLNEAENRFCNPVRFFDSSGKLLYQQPATRSGFRYPGPVVKKGKGYMLGDQLVNEPFDFTAKNKLYLGSLHQMIRNIMFPETIKKERSFDLREEDYQFLRKYMSMMPAESDWPAYDSSSYWDTYVKFIFYGAEKGAAVPGIRIFNKPGDAYGFLLDAAYFADFTNQTEFILSAVIHCNSDGIYNDDQYEYQSVGLPFMKKLGRLIAAYEQTRVRKHRPDLRAFEFSYHK